jgi:hypothetical protein
MTTMGVDDEDDVVVVVDDDEPGEEEPPLCSARASGPGNAAGVASLTYTHVAWRPDDPAAAPSRSLAVKDVSGALQWSL